MNSKRNFSFSVVYSRIINGRRKQTDNDLKTRNANAKWKLLMYGERENVIWFERTHHHSMGCVVAGMLYVCQSSNCHIVGWRQCLKDPKKKKENGNKIPFKETETFWCVNGEENELLTKLVSLFDQFYFLNGICLFNASYKIRIIIRMTRQLLYSFKTFKYRNGKYK